MNKLEFEVIGNPAPAGSKKAFVIRGRPIVVDASGEAGRVWRAMLQDRALQAVSESHWSLTRSPILLNLMFFKPRPKSHYNSKGDIKPNTPAFPVGKPDLTKLVRAVEDALTGIIWHDDAQIVEQKVSKHWGETPYVHIAVTELDGGDE